ncbi:MAG: hypothetical protein QXP36_03640 [Conexivisphaerales archaeon]
MDARIFDDDITNIIRLIYRVYALNLRVSVLDSEVKSLTSVAESILRKMENQIQLVRHDM